ncbi:MAG: LON peptidase substrate-binding domain-containing protein [Myxococcales bacterium]|nr:LON peptidase substrate-binding domain-containing protein [Myxococcales bacterium]MCB9735607.1 LON peptidase substrate-binding domain-containing protein [Deltaproteobacteria bacterium]
MSTTDLPQAFDAIVPLLPLPEHVLLPATPTPYRVFEPPYRQMVADLLEKPACERWLAVPRVLSAVAPGVADAPISPIASVGLMTLATPLSDGDYLIVVDGRRPCRIDEVHAPFTPYRVARATPLGDRPNAAFDPGLSTASLIQGLFSLLAALGPAAAELPVACGGELSGEDVVYRIASAVIECPDKRQAVLETRCPRERRRIVRDELAATLLTAGLPLGDHHPTGGPTP